MKDLPPIILLVTLPTLLAVLMAFYVGARIFEDRPQSLKCPGRCIQGGDLLEVGIGVAPDGGACALDEDGCDDILDLLETCPKNCCAYYTFARGISCDCSCGEGNNE